MKIAILDNMELLNPYLIEHILGYVSSNDIINFSMISKYYQNLARHTGILNEVKMYKFLSHYWVLYEVFSRGFIETLIRNYETELQINMSSHLEGNPNLTPAWHLPYNIVISINSLFREQLSTYQTNFIDSNNLGYLSYMFFIIFRKKLMSLCCGCDTNSIWFPHFIVKEKEIGLNVFFEGAELIQESDLEKNNNLKFNDCGKYLIHVPPEIKYFTNLRTIRSTLDKHYDSAVLQYRFHDIAPNLIIPTLPNEIGELKYLTILDIPNIGLIKLPDSICNCNTLETLNMSTNRLTRLPVNIGKLDKLIRLNIDNNNIHKLPNSVKKLLVHLKEFSYHNNQIGLKQLISFGITE